MGGDFALTEARSLLSSALNALNAAHKKREKREERFKQNEEQERVKKLNLEQRRLMIKKLDEMMELEKLKLGNGINPFQSP